MTYTVGKPVAIEQTIVGTKDESATYISVVARIKVNIRVSGGIPGNELEHGTWEPALRERIAASALGIGVDGLVVDTCAITRFEDA